MRKYLIYGWTAAAALLLGAAIYFYSGTFKHQIRTYQNRTERSKLESYKKTIYDSAVLDSLLLDNEYVLLAVGSKGCSACDILLLSNVPDKLGIPVYYIDKMFHPTNTLVAQALYSTSAPTSYLVDKEHNILGSFCGSYEMEEVLTDIIHGRQKHIHSSLPECEENSYFDMLGGCLKCVNASLRQDLDNMYRQAIISLGHGSCFFNNYVLYKYFQSQNMADSVNHYRTQALTHITDAGVARIYESSLRELDPANEFLAWIQEQRDNSSVSPHR